MDIIGRTNLLIIYGSQRVKYSIHTLHKPVRLKQKHPAQFYCTQHSTPCPCDLKLTNIYFCQANNSLEVIS